MTCRTLSIVVMSAALVARAATTTADPLDNWIWRGPAPTSNALNAITYGDGLFVAVGGNNGPGGIITSSDGVTWTVRSAPIDRTLLGVGHGGGQFVAVGEAGALLTSRDGILWTVQQSGTTKPISDVCYGNGMYAAVGANGTVITSRDAVSWQAREAATKQNLSAVTYGNDAFVAVGGYRTFVRSTDGVVWTLIESGREYLDHRITDIAFGNGLFVAAGNDSASGQPIITSPDGIEWTAATTRCIRLHGVVYGGGQFVAVPEKGAGATSRDGVNWVCGGSVDPIRAIYGVAYGQGRYVAVGRLGALFTSPDGVNWNSVQTGAFSTLFDVAWGNDIFVAAGTKASIYDLLFTYKQGIVTSLDGAVWRQEMGMQYLDPLRAVAFGLGKFVGVSQSVAGPSSQVSANGSQWQSDFFGTNPGGAGVTFGNGVFVSVGPGVSRQGQVGAVVGVSTNGLHWTQLPTSEYLNGVTFGNGRFIAVGWGGAISVSTNSVDWGSARSGTSVKLNRAGYGNGKYVVTGASGTILVSDDGLSWTPTASGTTNALYGIAYGDGNYVVVGANGTILTSPDALTWSPRSSGTRNDLFGAVYARDTFVVVGADGTILQSGAGPFSIRIESVQAHPDGLEIHLGGASGHSLQIEASTNLVNWFQVSIVASPKDGVIFLDDSPTRVSRRFYRAVAR